MNLLRERPQCWLCKTCIQQSPTVDPLLSEKKEPFEFSFCQQDKCFSLWTGYYEEWFGPQTLADILLKASITMAPFLFIFFSYGAPSIARASRLSSRRKDNGFLTSELRVKDVATPTVSLQNTNPHNKSQQTYRPVNTETHTNLIWTWIKSHPFVFQTAKEGGKMLLEVVYTGNHFFTTVFGVAHLPPFHFSQYPKESKRFQSLYSCQPDFSKLLTAKSMLIL